MVSAERDIAAEAAGIAVEAAVSETQQEPVLGQRSENARPVQSSGLPPASWGRDWFLVGLVGIGLLGLAYIILRKD